MSHIINDINMIHEVRRVVLSLQVISQNSWNSDYQRNKLYRLKRQRRQDGKNTAKPQWGIFI